MWAAQYTFSDDTPTSHPADTSDEITHVGNAVALKLLLEKRVCVDIVDDHSVDAIVKAYFGSYRPAGDINVTPMAGRHIRG